MLAPFDGARRQCVDMAVGDSDLLELGMTPREVLRVTRSLHTGASGRTPPACPTPRHCQPVIGLMPIPFSGHVGPDNGADHDRLTPAPQATHMATTSSRRKPARTEQQRR
ncbi:hypothetical protein [Streptomyces marincola]|uniref:hypothetical protein n=1 Tax=Streptomyces marincola TaxID=2878388 RepID=UPI001CF2E62E|nr:hypothetical protein [Streptomyces marincola]UCM89730.1 hypothetical protein LC193_18200 [Streptomyces marincola]